MRSFPVVVALLLSASPFAFAGQQIQGVATDMRGNPLAGVVVKRLSTDDSTTSAADGSWRLAWTTGTTRRSVPVTAPSGTLSLRDGRLRLATDGFRIDGKRDLSGGGVAIPSVPAAPRAMEGATDTLSMRWKGASFKRPLTADAPSGDLGRMSLDTTGLGRFEVRASRYEAMGLSCLRLDVSSIDSIGRDSLALRLHMSGTVAEMADFAVWLDIAQFYDAAGFSRPAKVDVAGISRIRPRPLDGACAAGIACDWVVDIPLDPVVFTPCSMLQLQLVVGRRSLAGDSSGVMMQAPTHDPFAGSDWSFRPHPRDGEVYYAGTPLFARDELERLPTMVPLDPYVQLVRGGTTIYGRGPEPED